MPKKKYDIFYFERWRIKYSKRSLLIKKKKYVIFNINSSLKIKDEREK